MTAVVEVPIVAREIGARRPAELVKAGWVLRLDDGRSAVALEDARLVSLFLVSIPVAPVSAHPVLDADPERVTCSCEHRFWTRTPAEEEAYVEAVASEAARWEQTK